MEKIGKKQGNNGEQKLGKQQGKNREIKQGKNREINREIIGKTIYIYYGKYLQSIGS